MKMYIYIMFKVDCARVLLSLDMRFHFQCNASLYRIVFEAMSFWTTLTKHLGMKTTF